MPQVIQFKPRAKVTPKAQVVLDESILRSRIARKEKFTQAYLKLANTGSMPAAYDIARECQFELDCMIAQYTGSFGELR